MTRYIHNCPRRLLHPPARLPEGPQRRRDCLGRGAGRAEEVSAQHVAHAAAAAAAAARHNRRERQIRERARNVAGVYRGT